MKSFICTYICGAIYRSSKNTSVTVPFLHFHGRNIPADEGKGASGASTQNDVSILPPATPSLTAPPSPAGTTISPRQTYSQGFSCPVHSPMASI
jgi:hypothetical protein